MVKSNSSAPADKAALNWVIWGGAIATLAVLTPLNDPFNAPKSWIISIAAFWLLGWIIFQAKDVWGVPSLKWATLVASGLSATLVVAFLATDNKYIGFFGEYQRRTGLLTYLSLIIFFLASSYLINLRTIIKLEIVLGFSGFLIGIYGLAQHFHHDFARWNNPYNSVLSTMGNPDFAAAAMSIFLIISFGSIIQSKHHAWFRIFSCVNILLLAIVIKYSQVRQGILTSVLGIAIIFIVWVYQKKKYVAYALTTSLLGSLIFAVFGMLKIGPLTKYFYKISVTFRGDYWRAGWKMFIHHPWLGVGLDRYGAYFRQYRDTTQAVRRGPNLISNAAHNVPLQLAATGGLFVLIAYLVFISFTLWRGVTALRKSQGQQQILISVIFAAWVAYQAQSLISIDNIGIAILGYILAGALIGLSLSDVVFTNKGGANLGSQQVTSLLLLAFPLVLSILAFQSETAMHKLLSTRPPSVGTQSASYDVLLKKPLSYGFREPSFVTTVARGYLNIQQIQQGSILLNEEISGDPRSFEAKDQLAFVYEYQKKWSAAIGLRSEIKKIDPYNMANLLSLGEDFKAGGNLAAAGSITPLIEKIDPSGIEAKQARSDFTEK
jgi:O-antigen ligase